MSTLGSKPGATHFKQFNSSVCGLNNDQCGREPWLVAALPRAVRIALQIAEDLLMSSTLSLEN